MGARFARCRSSRLGSSGARSTTSIQRKLADVKNQEHHEAEDHLGAVEGDRPTDPQQGNQNAPALNDNGQPNDPIKICEDVIGANADGTEG
jgi:hypothetical protein